MPRTWIPAAALAAALAAVPAHAGGGPAHPTRTVRFADLDLTTSAGVAALDRRIEGAVKAVCPSAIMRSGLERAEAEHCWTVVRANTAPMRNQVVEAAQAGHPAVVAIAIR